MAENGRMTALKKTDKIHVYPNEKKFLYILLLLFVSITLTHCETHCGISKCFQGYCSTEANNTICKCFPGWVGNECSSCGGRVKLTAPEGFISDGYGNYSLNTKCSWIIEGSPGSKILLDFQHFATECSWDHLYIYDGKSVFDKLIAVISGLVIPMVNSGNVSLPVFTASSGSAFLHFYSDAAYNMSGFNITYRMNACPRNCSGNGVCNSGVCQCDQGWKGHLCNQPLCPNDCGDDGTCDKATGCKCDKYKGPDCSTPPEEGLWEEVAQVDHIASRASHKAVVISDDMWVVSGDHFRNEEFQELAKFNFGTKQWQEVKAAPGRWPTGRYGHSLAHAEMKLYMYGGLTSKDIASLVKKHIVNELWVFDIDATKWTLEEGGESLPYAVVGHSAHIIGTKMYVLFGHSPDYGYTNFVQEYDLVSKKWEKVKTTGAIVKGGYGHSSVYSSDSGKIYVHGGHVSESSSTYALLDTLYEYDPVNRKWRVLRKSGQQRYLHSSVLLNNLVLVFGGNVHNDTSMSRGARCHSAEFLAYDIACDQWLHLKSPQPQEELARFGQSAVTYQGKMYVFGGFRATMLNDLLVYEPGDCTKYTTRDSCVNAHPGTRCVYAGSGCMTPIDAKKMKTLGPYDPPVCNYPPGPGETDAVCKSISTCPTCTENSYNCSWCGQCMLSSSCDKSILQDICKDQISGRCHTLHNCHACLLDTNCGWHARDNKCYHFGDATQGTQSNEKSGQTQDLTKTCSPSCNVYSSCENCTQHHCMWCSNQQRCVESNSYVASYPYGQCMEWATKPQNCPATRCVELRTCKQCLENPSCGWCDDGSETGLGTCMEGGSDGPFLFNETGWQPHPQRCPAPHWNFVNCPLCQCNGHSTCLNGTSICKDCQNNTTGDKCDMCGDGYHGNPVNGALCQACQCNEQADSCEHRTGICHCRTRGVTGDYCHLCDKDYFGNPRHGGTCYYDLTTDYQFTFNLSKKDDKFYTRIHFKNTPPKADSDVDFHINCSGKAYVNITFKSKSKQEETHIRGFECKYKKLKFSHRDYSFTPEENTTFFVYVHDFETPFWLQISFSQLPKIDLVHFFVTFFSCFLSLLLIAAIIWKVKNRYNLYMRRRMEFVQMEQRASRPFGIVALEVDHPFLSDRASLLKTSTTHTDTRGSRRKRQLKKTAPSPVALEPLKPNKAAIVSLVFRLPTGDEDYTPNGTSGLAIGSALVSVGNSNRKASIDREKGDKVKRKQGAMGAAAEPNCV